MRGEQHAGEDRPEVVLRRRPHHLPQRGGERGGVDGDALTVARREPRVVLGRLESQRSGEPARADHGFVTGDRDRDRARLEPAHDLAEQLRDDRDALLLDLGRDLHPVRDLEVGADELEPVVGGGDPQVLEDRQRATAAGNGPLGGGNRLGEGVTLAPELHWALLNTTGLNTS